MAEKNKNLPMCQDGKVCGPVMELTFYLKAMKKDMLSHTEDSKKFWEETQTKVDGVVEGMQKGALMFNDGGHKMEKLSTDINGVGEKLRIHEEGKYGAHSTMKRKFGILRAILFSTCFISFITIIFVIKKHPDLIDIILKKI